MLRPPLGIFLGDTHVMSNRAVALPGFPVPSDQFQPYAASADQTWLYLSFRRMAQKIKTLAKSRRLFIGLGGDMTDGVVHHGTISTDGNHSDQVLMTYELLKDIIELADEAAGVLGTVAHVGEDGDQDAMLYSLLGIPYAARYEKRLGGRLLHWAHTGLNVGQSPATEENGLIQAARSAYLYAKQTNQRPPDALIGHHRHRAPHPVNVRGISAAICPCWQMSTYYGVQYSPHRQPTIGWLTWDTETNLINVIDYHR